MIADDAQVSIRDIAWHTEETPGIRFRERGKRTVDSLGITTYERDAVREALARLVNIERTYRVPVTIETIESLRNESIDDATLRQAKRLGPQAKGVFVLMSKVDHKLKVIASVDLKPLNAPPRREAIQTAFTDEFRKGNYDLGLRRGIEAIERNLALLKAEGILLFRPRGTESLTRVTEIATSYGRIRTVQQGPDGALYFTTSNSDGADGVYRLTQ